VLWSLFQRTWEFDDRKRPTFAEIRSELGSFISSQQPAPITTPTPAAPEASVEAPLSSAAAPMNISSPEPMAAPAVSSSTATGPEPNITFLQIGNETYGGDRDLPMARYSVKILSDVCETFYSFQRGTIVFDQTADQMKVLVETNFARLCDSKGLSLIHFVGHGGNKDDRFIFEGTPGSAPESDSIDIERDIIARIPPDHRGPIVVLLDCCRSTMGSEEEPFAVANDNVVVGFAAEHGRSAYGCLYSFLLAKELWAYYKRPEPKEPLSWNRLLGMVADGLSSRTRKFHAQNVTPPADSSATLDGEEVGVQKSVIFPLANWKPRDLIWRLVCCTRDDNSL
jgi:hypothetical protein